MAQFPAPTKGIVPTHFIVASGAGRSQRFYAGVPGGEVLRDGEHSPAGRLSALIIAEVRGSEPSQSRAVFRRA
jgi:hypothetical protein